MELRGITLRWNDENDIELMRNDNTRIHFRPSEIRTLEILARSFRKAYRIKPKKEAP